MKNEKIYDKVPVWINEAILKRVSYHFDVQKDVILRRTRKREIVNARQVYIYIIHVFFNVPSTFFQEAIGYDHATVNHCKKVVHNLYETDVEYRDKFNILKEEILVFKNSMEKERERENDLKKKKPSDENLYDIVKKMVLRQMNQKRKRAICSHTSLMRY